jgi:hypothetical protein
MVHRLLIIAGFGSCLRHSEAAADEFPAKPMEKSMLAQVFNPTEIKNNGPATRPAIAPARRVAFLFNAGWVVLDGTAHSYCEADAPSIDAGRICRPDESRRGAPKRVNLRYSDRHRIRAA